MESVDLVKYWRIFYGPESLLSDHGLNARIDLNSVGMASWYSEWIDPIISSLWKIWDEWKEIDKKISWKKLKWDSTTLRSLYNYSSHPDPVNRDAKH